jgi:uncharacterized phage infection (PIP) family protein YhgE
VEAFCWMVWCCLGDGGCVGGCKIVGDEIKSAEKEFVKMELIEKAKKFDEAQKELIEKDEKIEDLQIEIEALNLVLETERGLIKELEKENKALKDVNEKLSNRLFLLEQHQAIILNQSEKIERYEKALKLALETLENNNLMGKDYRKIHVIIEGRK